MKRPINRHMRTIILAVALMLGLSSGLAAPVLAGDDATDSKAVISSQAEALSRDDAAAAYSFAAPTIRKLFPDAGTFMTMVQSGYAPVYRHRSLQFGALKREDGELVQEVQIVDDAGVAWSARYALERQSDGSLKISGCRLTKMTTA